MYKVVLADDEKWILESLKGTLDWNGLGFRIAGEASNGLEAFELIDSLRPDIAFIDIRMPGLNGLELIRKLHEAGSDTLCVVASGYAEFEYARQAMQFGAAGYCLKPFNAEEITGILVGVKPRLERMRQSVRNELLLLLQERELPPEEELDRLLGQLRFDWDREDGVFAAVVRGKGAARISLPGGGPFVALRIGTDTTAYLIRQADRTDAIECLETVLPTADGIGVGGSFLELAGIRDRFAAAEAASYDGFIRGAAGIGMADDNRSADGGLDDGDQRLLADGFDRKDARLVREGLAAAEAHFRSGRYDIRHALRLYNTVLSALYRTTNGSAESYRSSYSELAASFDNVYAMLDELRRQLGDQLADPDGGAVGRRGEETFAQIVQHVRDHFREPLSIQDISKKFYMHPNYVSQLFKKELQVSFTKYVTDIRMEYACMLLGSTGLSVSEIAEQAGYGDYFYFARAFKKHTGLTPTEYRTIRGKLAAGSETDRSM